MSYDGRLPNIPWREQNINSMGYHYLYDARDSTKGIRQIAGCN